MPDLVTDNEYDENGNPVEPVKVESDTSSEDEEEPSIAYIALRMRMAAMADADARRGLLSIYCAFWAWRLLILSLPPRE